MNIQIRITIHTKQHDDEFLAEAIERIMVFIRSLFPDMQPGRMDSPVIVTIRRMEDELP